MDISGYVVNLMSAAVAVGYMDQGFERKYSGCRRRRFSPPPVWFILLQSHFSRAIRRRMRRGSSETARRGRNISEQEKHMQYTIRRLSLLSADSLPRIGQFQRPCLVHIRQFRQLFAPLSLDRARCYLSACRNRRTGYLLPLRDSGNSIRNSAHSYRNYRTAARYLSSSHSAPGQGLYKRSWR